MLSNAVLFAALLLASDGQPLRERGDHRSHARRVCGALHARSPRADWCAERGARVRARALCGVRGDAGGDGRRTPPVCVGRERLCCIINIIISIISGIFSGTIHDIASVGAMAAVCARARRHGVRKRTLLFVRGRHDERPQGGDDRGRRRGGAVGGRRNGQEDRANAQCGVACECRDSAGSAAAAKERWWKQCERQYQWEVTAVNGRRKSSGWRRIALLIFFGCSIILSNQSMGARAGRSQLEMEIAILVEERGTNRIRKTRTKSKGASGDANPTTQQQENPTRTSKNAMYNGNHKMGWHFACKNGIR